MLTTCNICGLTYCSDVGGDVRSHNNRHRRALAAREELHKVGPCELPLSYSAREQLKRFTDDATEHLRLVMWSHFSRSLSSKKFNLRKHPSWPEYAKAYLAQKHTVRCFGAPAVQAVTLEFGGAVPNLKLREGSSYWGG
jgi:hypothetical protein